MKTPFARLNPRDQVLALDPEARFTHGALPGRPRTDIVLLSTRVRATDLPAICQIARTARLVVHSSQSALAAGGNKRAHGWTALQWLVSHR